MLIRIRLLPIIAFSLALGTIVLGQTATTLNNASVLKLKTAGIDDATIVKAIEASPGNYDVSADGIIALKAGGATETILAAILQKVRAATAAAASSKPAVLAVDPYPDELGVY